MLVDSHSHLAHQFLANKTEDIVNDAAKNGVRCIITIGCTIKEAEESIVIANKFPNVYATAGLYPRDIKEEAQLSLDEKLSIIKKLAQDSKVVAIGECGLDFSEVGEYEIDHGEEEQIERFEKQIYMAKEVGKPLIIHSRNAVDQTLNIFKSSSRNQNAVWHCFSESSDTAEKALSAGLHISFTGNITYPKNIDLRETVKMVPLDRIMVETDSPYLTPHKARGEGVKRNSPQYVRMIAEEIAEIKGISLNQVEEFTTKTASKFFGINLTY